LIMGVFSWLLYLLFLVYVHFGSQFKSIGTMATVFFSGKFYLTFVLIVGTCYLFDTFTYTWDSLFNNRITSTMMRLVKWRGVVNDTKDLPKEVIDCLNKYNVYDNDDKKENKVPAPRICEDIPDIDGSVIARSRKSLNEFDLKLLKKKSSRPNWVETLKVDELFEVQKDRNIYVE
jgi:hypothetical protein